MKGRYLRKIGYKDDQQGIINRYLRERGGWDTHLMKTREYILEIIKKQSPTTVTFLGSGWLLDIPLEELCEITETVNLVDMIHPSQVRYKAEKIGGVKLYEEDITGGLVEEIYKRAGKKDFVPDEIDIPEYKPSFDTGLVFSVNILTQLDSLPVDYIIKKTGLSYEEVRGFRGRLQKAHIDFLQSKKGVLITDYSELIKTEGKTKEINKLLFTALPHGENKKKWEWDFDSTGNYYKGKRVVFEVRAMCFEK